MMKFRDALLLAFVVLQSVSYAEAYLCMCSPTNCVLIHPNTAFFDSAENYCSSFRTSAYEISIIKLMDTQLSSEAFVKFPNMTSLEIFQGQLEKIAPDTFNGAGRLMKLLIRGNSLANLEDYTFKGADNLRDLVISASPLKRISEKAFANLQQLEMLILAHGDIESLPKKLFENNRMLKMLSLNSNKLTSIDADVFSGLDELAKLELADNQLKTFDYKFLKAAVVVLNNNSLQHLVINEHCSAVYASNNEIETISIDGSNVLKLSLNHNRIHDVSNITKLANLSSLSLGSNTLESNSIFSPLVALEELILQSTYINLTRSTFENLSNLKILDLSYNNLTVADFKIFNSQSALQILSYVGNRIPNFNYFEAKQILPRLRVLEICKNGWNKTYFEYNIMRMKRFQINPDIHGFASHFLFRDEYVDMCTEKLIEDYNYDDYPEPPADADIEDEIKKSYPTEQTLPTTTTVSTTQDTIHQNVHYFPLTPQSNHHISEHDVPVTSEPTVKKQQPEEEASPLLITFQVLVYILSVVGLVSLGVVAYLWRKRQLDVRRLAASPESADAVRLI
ncbi:carboxypeptidase N subunit 2-like [Toxorhynchites rutilus septentrionalis]|uniref:carboxypeptidase N subunit 2-like n=1 Tax=Toxorhynchites rutilus septentrionalis TaxID=329112 RepID=UPI002478A4EB|nr:carboxypeptidase N subunit 2-like [Toxorhynchites rutilus septentrionalis]